MLCWDVIHTMRSVSALYDLYSARMRRREPIFLSLSLIVYSRHASLVGMRDRDHGVAAVPRSHCACQQRRGGGG